VQKNVAGQSVTLLVVDASTGLQKSGDAANLIFYASKDDGSVVAISSNSGVPSEIDATNAKGLYRIALSQAETNADKLLFSGKSTTANIVVVPTVIYTTPANFAKLVVDSSGLADANAVKVGPTGAGTAQTARDLGTSVLISSGTGTGQLDVTSGVVKSNLAQILGTALTETAGLIAAGFKKFFNVASPTLTVAGVDQTGDSFNRIGATGSGLTSLAPARRSTPTARPPSPPRGRPRATCRRTSDRPPARRPASIGGPTPSPRERRPSRSASTSRRRSRRARSHSAPTRRWSMRSRPPGRVPMPRT
jgi:hypothetical protein